MIAALLSRRGLVTALLLVLLALLPLLTSLFDQRYLLSVGTRIVIWAIAATSLNMILGYGGLVSFGHAAFFGIGGYVVGILSANGIQDGWLQWPLALMAAILWGAPISTPLPNGYCRSAARTRSPSIASSATNGRGSCPVGYMSSPTRCPSSVTHPPPSSAAWCSWC